MRAPANGELQFADWLAVHALTGRSRQGTRRGNCTSRSFLHATMSDKIKEFIEIPQQFVREGNQVRSTLAGYWKVAQLP